MNADSGLPKPSDTSNPKRVFPRVPVAAAITAALLIPCFWLDHIEAGDLPSHVYNAWLAIQIKAGHAPGLAIRQVWTNTLADYGLERFLRMLGPVAAERAVACIAVVIFFWGVLSLVRAATGKHPWVLIPSLGMVTYGLVFQFGFLNYYLATGLCAWAIACFLRRSRAGCLIGCALAGAAVLANPLPVVWAAGVVGYFHIFRALSQRRRKWMLPAAALAVASMSVVLRLAFPSLFSPGGPFLLAGVEQIYLFGISYELLAAALLACWVLFLLQRVHQGTLLDDPWVQLWLLNTLATMACPLTIRYSQFQHALAYIPPRISLLSVVLFFVVIGGAAKGRTLAIGTAVVAIAFFSFLYVDDRAFNALENRIGSLVRTLPPGQRVVASIQDQGARLNAVAHIADRACLGYCFSYGDYEPATRQFRIRIAGPTTLVAPDIRTVQEIDDGVHIVTPQEAPLYSVCASEDGASLYLRAIQAGERICRVEWKISRMP